MKMYSRCSIVVVKKRIFNDWAASFEPGSEDVFELKVDIEIFKKMFRGDSSFFSSIKEHCNVFVNEFEDTIIQTPKDIDPAIELIDTYTQNPLNENEMVFLLSLRVLCNQAKHCGTSVYFF